MSESIEVLIFAALLTVWGVLLGIFIEHHDANGTKAQRARAVAAEARCADLQAQLDSEYVSLDQAMQQTLDEWDAPWTKPLATVHHLDPTKALADAFDAVVPGSGAAVYDFSAPTRQQGVE